MSEHSIRLDEARDRLQAQAPEPYLTVEEVARLAHCEHKAVRRAIWAGELQAFRPVKQILVRQADAVQWIEERPARAPGSRPRRATRRHQASSVASIREMDPALR